jgi:glycerol-3-phosphate acyltransferase PlsY
VGQVWSVWLGWTGGKAQTIFITGFLVLCPVAMALAALTFIGSLLVTKRFYLSNVVFHLAAPVCLLLASTSTVCPLCHIPGLCASRCLWHVLLRTRLRPMI